MSFDRRDTSFLGRWWWTIDRYMLVSIGAIMVIGVVLVMAASPAVAEHKGLHSFYFVHKHIKFLALGLGIMLAISMFSPVHIRRFAIASFFGCMVLLIAVPILGIEIKGAKRWISVLGFTLQPSEFIKPFFIVVTAWILALKNTKSKFPGYRLSGALYLLVATTLVLQPDIGMTIVVTVVWVAQLFLAGLPLLWFVAAIILGVLGVSLGYMFFPHVQDRINIFLDPGSGDNYQVAKSIQAFKSGGFLGQGPGEGKVKEALPDSHTDFIFAVAGEELGVLFALIIVFLFAFVVIRGFFRIYQETDLFVVFATSGLLIQFGVQVIVNMGVTLNLLPSTGMTLPFISYGGSSMLAVSLGMGMILSFTRTRYGSVMMKWSSRRNDN